MTLAEAAAPLQRSQATMSRLENGSTPPRQVDIEKLLDVYREAGVTRVDEARPRILALLDAGRAKEWFSRFRDVLVGDLTDDHLETYVGYETYAENMISFEPELVAGLVQTRRYAAAVTEAFFPQHTGHQKERLVELRMERGDTLRKRGTPRLDLILGEGALTRVFGGVEIMSEQLDSISAEIRNGTSNIRLRIAPATLTLPAAIGGPFVVLTFADSGDRDLVYLEGRAGATYLTDPTMVENYREQFAALEAVCLTDGDALERLEEVRRELS